MRRSAKFAVGRRPATWIGLVLLVVLGLPTASATNLPTLTTIIVDGNFEDWQQVLLNPLQVSTDGNGSSTGVTDPPCYTVNPDRDCERISGTGRDITTFAWTYDDNNIYTYLERVGAGNMHYLFVMDLDGDNIAKATDKVLDVTWSGSGGPTLNSVALYNYSPGDAINGDPLVCTSAVSARCPAPGALGFADGYSMAGSFGAKTWEVTNVPGGSAAKDRFEVYLPWAQLGLPKGSPINWHVASSVNGTFNQVIDNVGGATGGIGTFGSYAVTFSPNREGSAGSPGVVEYCHSVENAAQFLDSYDIRATSSTGSRIDYYRYYVDAGVCTPTGAPLATDLNGNGVVNSGDTPSADGGIIANTGVLDGGAIFPLLLRLQVGSGLNNTRDLLHATAYSTRNAPLAASIDDTTRIGAVTIGPDQVRGGVAGATVPFNPFTVTNNTGGTDNFEFDTSSSHSWALSLYEYLADGGIGSPLPGGMTGDIDAGTSVKVWLQTAIPDGTDSGIVDSIVLTARATTVPGPLASAQGELTVMERLTIRPSYTAPATALLGSAGSSVYFPHEIINGWSFAEAVTFDAGVAPPAGYVMRWWTDPNGDGNPADGVLIDGGNPITVAPFGGVTRVVTEVRIPAGGTGTVNSATLVQGDAGTRLAQDDLIVNALQTYEDSLFTRSSRYFPVCGTIYARGSSLASNATATYTLSFVNDAGVSVSSANLATNGAGVGTGSYAVAADAGAGSWKVRINNTIGGAQIAAVDPVFIETEAAVSITVPDGGASGDPLPLSSAQQNLALQSDYESTVVEYLVQDPALATFLSTTVGPITVPVGTSVQASTAWGSFSYPDYGNYTATATWKTWCGSTLATDSKTFKVPPPAPTLVSPANGAVSATTTPSLTGTAVPSASVVVYLDGSDAGVVAGGAFSFSPAALTQGLHTWTATQTVNSVTSPAATTRSFTVDTVAPASSFTSPASGTYFTSVPVAIAGASSDATSGVQTVEITSNGGTTWTAASGTNPWSFSFSPADGVYTLKSRATDNANNVEDPLAAGITITVDQVAPVTVVTSPAASSYFKAADLPISIAGTVSDATSGVAGVQVSTDNGSTWSAASYAAGSWSFDFSPVTNGTYNVKVKATDLASNVEDPPIGFSFVYDSVDPSSSLTAPADGAVFTTAPISITATASDATSGVQKVEVSTDNGATWANATLAAGVWTYDFTPSGDGSYTLRTRATDNAGNLETPSAGRTVKFDTTGPLSWVTSPATGSAFKIAPIALAISASDATSGIDKVEVSTDNGATWTDASGTGPWTYDFTPGSEGSYSIRTRATDLAGHLETPGAGITVKYDLTAPVTTLTAPVASTYFKAGDLPIAITATATDGNSGVASVQVSTDDGSTWSAMTLAAGTWSHSFSPASDGTYTVKLKATDLAGNEESPALSFTLVYDTTLPNSGFTSPASGAVFKTASVNVAGTSSDATAGVKTVELTSNGGATWTAVTGTNPWSLSFTPPSDGVYTLQSRATDFSNNQESPLGAGIVVTVDTTPPATVVTAPIGSNYFKAADLPIVITATATDALSGVDKVEVSTDNGSTWSLATLVGGVWSYSFSPTTDGTYDVKLRATDVATNVETPAVGFSLVYDSVDPSSSLTAPADGAVLTAAPISITASASDATSGVQKVEVSTDDGATWANATLAAGVWTYDFTPSGDGSYTLRTRATDNAGNLETPSAGRTVKFDTTDPLSWVTSPATGSAFKTTPIALAISASDATSGIDKVEVSTDNGANWTDASGTGPWTYDFTPGSEGSYSIRTRATDLAGHLETPGAGITVRYDLTAPVTTLTAPVVSTFFKASDLPIAITATATDGNSGVAGVQVSTDDGSTWSAMTLAAGTWGYSFSPASDGTYTVKLKATDLAGNEETPALSFTLVYDTTLPGSAITAPATGSVFDTATVNVSGTASDALAGVKTVELTSNGGTSWTAATGTGPWSFTFTPPSDGVYTLQSRATDFSNNEESPLATGITVTVDTTPPATLVTFPAPGAIFDAADLPIVITATATDAVSGVDKVEVSTDNGNTWTSASLAAGVWSYSFTPATSGTYDVKVRATDVATNVETPAVGFSLVYDAVLPSSNITAPGDGSSFAATPIVIAISASDTHSGIQKVEVSTDGVNWALASGAGPWTYDFAPAAEGAYTVQTRATDNAGNVETPTAGITVKYDTTAPASSITSPATGAAFGTAPLTLTISATDTTAGIKTVEVSTDNGATWTAATGTGPWSFDFTPASEGSYTILTRATDLADNVETPGAGITVRYDTTDPTSAITAPGTGTTLSSVPVTITGTASDGSFGLSKVEVSIDGGSWFTATLTGGSWTYLFIAPSDATYTVQSRATDAAGNLEVPGAGISFTFDSTLPNSSINIPVAGTRFKASDVPITISGVASATSGITQVELSFDNTTWVTATGTTSWTYAYTPAADGTVTVRSRASAGSGTVETPGAGVSFIYDATAPESAITSPADSTLLDGSVVPIVLSGTATDATAGLSTVEISVNGGAWTAATVTGGTWSYSYTPTADGTLAVQSRATDLAGNIENPGAGISLTFDTIAPASAVTAPASGSFHGSAVSISGTASDATSGVASVEVSINGGAWTAATGTGAWTYAFTASADGSYTVQSRATDVAGHAETPGAGITFVVDTVGPTSAITSPVTGSLQGGSVTISGTAADATSGVALVEVSINGGSWTAATGTGTWTYDFTATADGSYTVLSRATDAAGVTETPGTGISFLVDTVAPTSVITSPATGFVFSAAGVPLVIEGTAADATAGLDKVEISINGGAWTAVTGTSTWSYSVTPNGDGTITVTSRATDLAGHVEVAGAGISVQYDATPPVSVLTEPTAGTNIALGSIITVQGTASDATSGVVSVELRVNGGAWTAATGTTSWSFQVTAAAVGPLVLESRATDAAGNVETPQAGVTVVVTAPSDGGTDGGTTDGGTTDGGTTDGGTTDGGTTDGGEVDAGEVDGGEQIIEPLKPDLRFRGGGCGCSEGSGGATSVMALIAILGLALARRSPRLARRRAEK